MTEVGQIQVDTQLLEKTAQSFGNALKQIGDSLGQMEEILKQTGTFLRGDAGEAFRREVSERIGESRKKAREIGTLSEHLLQIAQQYKQTEGENKNVFNGT